MGLLQKLKSALGLDASGSPSAGTNAPQDVDVTVEREPSTESEDAVKGTETSGEPSAVEQESEETRSEGEEPRSEDEGETTEPSTAGTAETDDEVDEPVETVEDVSSSDDDPPITEVKGIGPAYAERLEEAGVSTVSDLAAADAEELGEATDLSPNRVSGWIEQANSF